MPQSQGSSQPATVADTYTFQPRQKHPLYLQFQENPFLFTMLQTISKPLMSWWPRGLSPPLSFLMESRGSHILDSLGLEPSDQPHLSEKWRSQPRCWEHCQMSRDARGSAAVEPRTFRSLSGIVSCACFSVGSKTDQSLTPAFCFSGKTGKAKIILYNPNCFYVVDVKVWC